MTCAGPRNSSAAVRALMVLWCTVAVVAAETMDCSTVIALTSRCSDFIAYGGLEPGQGSPCCNGLASLNSIMADSIDNRRTACSCIVALTTAYHPNATTIARLPGLCGLSLGFIGDPNTDCNRYVQAISSFL